MPVQLKIRRLESNETLIAEFESLDDAETWLKERPHKVDVLGALGVDEAASMRLREAMRPLDADEKALVEAGEIRAAAAARVQIEAEQKAHQEEIARRREQAADADPARPMAVAWELEQGCRNADAGDPRPVPEVVVEAVEAWVAERNSWVHPRGQHIHSANVMVWPGPIPGGDEADRIHPGGQFIPVSMG